MRSPSHHPRGYRTPSALIFSAALVMASSFLSGCGDTLPTDESDTLPPDVIVLLPDAEEDAGKMPDLSADDPEMEPPTGGQIPTPPDWLDPRPSPTPDWQRGARMEREPNDIVDHSAGLDQATYFTVGESVAGALDAPDRPEQDMDVFSVELSAGTLFHWEVVGTGEDLDAAGVQTVLLGPDMRYRRELLAHNGQGRSAFIHRTGTYYLAVHDPRDLSSLPEQDVAAAVDDSGYKIKTSTHDLQGYSIEAPGTWGEALEGFAPDVHRFVWNRDEAIMAEVVCHREPVHTGVDPILYIWDTIEHRVVVHNDNGRRDSLDPQIVADLERGRPYMLVVDAVAMRDEVPYALSISEVDDSPDVPTRVEAGSSWRAEIGAPVASMEHFDTDYFTVVLFPGEAIRVEVEADDALEPALTVYRDEGGFFDQIDFTAPRHGEAAVTFNLPADAQGPRLFYVLLDDLRNLQLGAHEWGRRYLGGPDFDYTLRAEAVAWAATPTDLPHHGDITLSEAGSYHWFDVWLEADELLSLQATSLHSDTFPALAMMSAAGEIELSQNADAFFSPRAGTYRFGVREEFMRTSRSPLSLSLFSVKPDTSNATLVQERSDNHSGELAQRLMPPAKVSSYAESVHTVGYDVFVVHAKAGQKLAAWTAPDPGAGNAQPSDTVLHLLDPNGDHIVSNDDRMATEYTTFSAILREVEQDGDYYVVVEPYSTRMFSLDGPYMLYVTLD